MGHWCLTLRQPNPASGVILARTKDKRVKLSLSNESTTLWFQLPALPNPAIQNQVRLMILTIDLNPLEVDPIHLCLKPDTHPADQLLQICRYPVPTDFGLHLDGANRGWEK